MSPVNGLYWLPCTSQSKSSLNLTLQVSAALCNLLATALQKVPAGVLQSKFGPVTSALCSVIERSNDEVRILCLRSWMRMSAHSIP